MAENENSGGIKDGSKDEGIGLEAFAAALVTGIAVFAVQITIFLLFRNKLARIYKPKTFLVPERERTDPPPASPWSLATSLLKISDRELIKKCGLDAYFFLRYLRMLLVIFIPIAFIVIPILVPINYVDGLGHEVVRDVKDNPPDVPRGLDTLAWPNLKPKNHQRRWAHLVMALAVIGWVCYIMFLELRIYIKVRQDYLTSAEHRLRASANTVLVSSIPEKWLTEDGLRGLFDVFPGGIRNIWITRDFTKLLEKVRKRDEIHDQLEAAQTELIREAKRRYLKKRIAEEKKGQGDKGRHRPTKDEIQKRQDEEDAEARLRAQQGGISAGTHEEVPHIDTAVEQDQRRNSYVPPEQDNADGSSKEAKGLGLGFIGKGIKGGVNVVGKAGHTLVGGAKTIQKGVDGQLEHTGGFGFLPGESRGPGSPVPPRPVTRGSDRRHRAAPMSSDIREETKKTSFDSDSGYQGHSPSGSKDEDLMVAGGTRPSSAQTRGNTTRKAMNLDGMIVNENNSWWKFWKAPSGGYASPVPQGREEDEFPLTGSSSSQKQKKTLWQRLLASLPLIGGEDIAPVEYPVSASEFAYSNDREDGAEWKKWLKESKRPTHRLPNFEWTPSWLPGLPLINKKVDTIYWARGELARLNMEIEIDQKHPERYPVMTSAFIQFNNQVAAHMACQSVTHHVPRQMTPRVVEVAPHDVIWENMAITWWDEWLRFAIVLALIVGMVILFIFPVVLSSGVSQIDTLVEAAPLLSFLSRNEKVYNFLKLVSGVLPAIILAIILAVVPLIFNYLAKLQGAKTGAQRSESVQVYYFAFLFFLLFLVVGLSTSAVSTLTAFFSANDAVNQVVGIPELLAKNLPKSANYFFTYMILQALSVSSGTLMQIGTLIVWYILGRLLDNTARAKWKRQTELPNVNWGSFFPVYTNFACIALIYSIVAPIIAIFAIITFSLLWLAHRYNMFYVTRFQTDTGGVLFPRAVNQLFTGLYVMELCLIGLFFLQTDERGNLVGFRQAIVMIVAMVITVGYQILLTKSFSPLFRYLPITFEDEAVLRDEAFQRAQDRRLGLVNDDPEDGDGDEAGMLRGDASGATREEIEMRRLSAKRRSVTGSAHGSKLGMLNPVAGIRHAGTWAVRAGKQIEHATLGKAEKNLKTAAQYRKERRMKDLEAQRAIGDALYGGFHDEIEDLTPDERDVLVREAFKHEALRSRRRAIWIPQDEIGVSDDEIYRTQSFSEYIWISNEGTALDSKTRVIYGRAPPDFSEMDLISL
ncbi:hypothetical protein MGG_04165 [Pyricularia oryzae 70-15]|uniref:Phosphate metabolism protein 7 n=3 Tax=Pyricularia oryzae TaxID=318829 RepID=G4NIP0_PYRO7|nr:uncharacterized protein MGG_04165 [Pyricularia oryzae 70-15]EHA47296.1 hypothetical protein MGG_04165 [Pyricularia oryzae 70-15]ELQ37763.1 hypothetical protein OOU_Y34scaffold00579g5 [Pyricularia oryzae Y34]KAI7929170.1 hypothetical protein M9X92_001364 [Pyricularia oryzae]KAI7930105.1 hypothetical protein M0657_001910 [Pyricularia oryzae]